MTQWFKALFVLAENSGLIPSMDLIVSNFYNTSVRVLMLWGPRAPGMHLVYIYMYKEDKIRYNV